MKLSRYVLTLSCIIYLFAGDSFQLEAKFCAKKIVKKNKPAHKKAHKKVARKPVQKRAPHKPVHKPVHKKVTHKPVHKKPTPKFNAAVTQLSNIHHGGAGVLPYCHHKGQLMFLIGKEGNNGQWADFGGGADKSDGNALITAIREASEETRWIFGHNNKKQSMNYFRSHITHVFRHPGGGYAMACAKVNYIPAHVFKNGPKVPHWEKVDYEWVPAHKLLGAIQHSDKFGNKTLRNFVAKILRQNAHILRTL